MPSYFTLGLTGSGHRVFKLALGMQLSTQELPELSARSPDGVVAEVCINPNDPSILGLKNLSTQSWKGILPDGSEGPIVMNKSIILAEGTRIDFGSFQGSISKC